MLKAVLFDWGDMSTGEPMVPPCAPSFSPSVGEADPSLRWAKPASGFQRILDAAQANA
jgi:hypothetical protein